MTGMPKTHLVSDNFSYVVDKRTEELLLESAPLMLKWSHTDCVGKHAGGMEEWAKTYKKESAVESCDWYHGTWQYLRLLNMVATPPWYPFYNNALGKVLTAKPNATVLISAAADWGMLAQLHEAILLSGAKPKIFLYDICKTPLLASEWYAERHGFSLECICDNIITSATMPLGEFDLIVTDEFMTVLKDEYKPQIATRWMELLKPGGTLVTTVMVGGPTTPELRDAFSKRARHLLDVNERLFEKSDLSKETLVGMFDHFANVHTRHMIYNPSTIESLFSNFDMSYSMVITPGECVNPTNSYQIVATAPG